MPYEISFRKRVEVKDPEIYINDCCWGGDVVQEQLLPFVKEQYIGIMTGQEDWGWYIWFRKDDVNLEINIYSDSKAGAFRIHISAVRLRFFGLSRRLADDSPEVEALAEKVTKRLREWTGAVHVEHQS